MIKTCQRKVMVCLFITLSFHLSAFSQVNRQALSQYFQALHQNQQFNGNILVAEKGKIIYEQSFGYADFEKKQINTSVTRFPIASISKLITATAILQLEQAGRLKIDDPVRKTLPLFPYADITIRHLLSHTSGLPPYNAYFDSVKNVSPGRVFTNADFLEGLSKFPRPLLYKPGDNGNYDNVNYIVLALLIEKISGLKYEEYVRKNVLIRAGMTSTKLLPLRVQYSDKDIDRFAYPYLFAHIYSDTPILARSIPYVAEYWSAYNFSGFADFVSTTHDLLKFDRAYQEKVLLSSATQQKAFIPVRLNNGRNNPANFGLGWDVEVDSSMGRIVYHSGGATGLSCVLMRNIPRDQTVVVYDNTHSNAYTIGLNALKLINRAPVPVPKKSITKMYATILLTQGAEYAREVVLRLKTDTAQWEINEEEINSLGYDLMGKSNAATIFKMPNKVQLTEAVEVFKLNTELFPSSWNVFDSYAESLAAIGKKEEAIRMYQKSIELNPANDNGREMLRKLGGK